MSDLIERQAAIDAVKTYLGDYEISRTVQCRLRLLPSAQPERDAVEAIPVAWIEEYIKKLQESLVSLTGWPAIEEMVKKWREEQ